MNWFTAFSLGVSVGMIIELLTNRYFEKKHREIRKKINEDFRRQLQQMFEGAEVLTAREVLERQNEFKEGIAKA